MKKKIEVDRSKSVLANLIVRGQTLWSQPPLMTNRLIFKGFSLLPIFEGTGKNTHTDRKALTLYITVKAFLTMELVQSIFLLISYYEMKGSI